jgi:hypothetical protein
MLPISHEYLLRVFDSILVALSGRPQFRMNLQLFVVLSQNGRPNAVKCRSPALRVEHRFHNPPNDRVTL